MSKTIRSKSMTSFSLDDDTYVQYKHVFVGWARKKWSGTKESVLEDVFHDALVILAQYQTAGKLNVAPTTFLIAVGNRMLTKQLSFQPYEPEEKAVSEEASPFSQELVRRGLQQLDDKCREILVCKYFYGFSMEEIREEIGTKTAQAVRVQKYRCIDKLKGIIKELMKAA